MTGVERHNQVRRTSRYEAVRACILWHLGVTSMRRVTLIKAVKEAYLREQKSPPSDTICYGILADLVNEQVIELEGKKGQTILSICGHAKTFEVMSDTPLPLLTQTNVIPFPAVSPTPYVPIQTTELHDVAQVLRALGSACLEVGNVADTIRKTCEEGLDMSWRQKIELLLLDIGDRLARIEKKVATHDTPHT